MKREDGKMLDAKSLNHVALFSFSHKKVPYNNINEVFLFQSFCKVYWLV